MVYFAQEVIYYFTRKHNMKIFLSHSREGLKIEEASSSVHTLYNGFWKTMKYWQDAQYYTVFMGFNEDLEN